MNDIIGNCTHDLTACSVVPLPGTLLCAASGLCVFLYQHVLSPLLHQIISPKLVFFGNVNLQLCTQGERPVLAMLWSKSTLQFPGSNDLVLLDTESHGIYTATSIWLFLEWLLRCSIIIQVKAVRRMEITNYSKWLNCLREISDFFKKILKFPFKYNDYIILSIINWNKNLNIYATL